MIFLHFGALYILSILYTSSVHSPSYTSSQIHDVDFSRVYNKFAHNDHESYISISRRVYFFFLAPIIWYRYLFSSFYIIHELLYYILCGIYALQHNIIIFTPLFVYLFIHLRLTYYGSNNVMYRITLFLQNYFAITPFLCV